MFDSPLLHTWNMVLVLYSDNMHERFDVNDVFFYVSECLVSTASFLYNVRFGLSKLYIMHLPEG